MRIAYVYIEHPIMELDRAFTYRCDGFSLCRGVRVRVPFGKKNTPLIGFVERIGEMSETDIDIAAYELKSILEVIDEEPLINEELFALAKWMAKTCVAPLISCFQVMLPSKLKPKRTMGTCKQETWVVYDHTPDQMTKRQTEVCQIMEHSIHTYFPACQVISIPIADGGEGSVESFLSAMGGQTIVEEVHGPFFEPLTARYGLLSDKKTAIIEVAAAAGLSLANGRENPCLITTYGTGEQIRSALEHCARKIIVGLGGSATNDAGAGAMAALGVTFYNAQGESFIPVGGTLKDRGDRAEENFVSEEVRKDAGQESLWEEEQAQEQKAVGQETAGQEAMAAGQEPLWRRQEAEGAGAESPADNPAAVTEEELEALLREFLTI